MKKALALILTLIMVLGLMPAAMAEEAPASPQQIGHYAHANDTDGTLGEPTEGIPSEKTLEDGKVIISKTIAATQTENVFDITLTVKTTETIENVSSAPDAAVVLVLDVSGSMGEGRLSSAKAAAQAFINSFAKDAGNAQRKVAIVKFSGDYDIDGAKTVQGWTEASSLVKTDGQQCAAIENLSAGGGTNLHAGLLLAKNLLNDSSVKDIENKSIVLLSDGKPTFFVDGNEANSQSIDVICKDGNSMGGDGRNTSHNTHTKVETLMKSDDLKGINKYAVYIGDEDIKCTSILSILSCKLNKPTSDWLRYDCGFSTYSVKDLTSLTGIFENIVKSILIKAQAWMVTDPMGTNIQFAGFTDCDSNATNEDNGTISWDLKKDNKYTTDMQGTTTTRTYTCKYKVKLDTLAQGFEANKEYPTNGITTLTYVIEKEGQTVTEADLKTAYFNVPSVKGFAGNLTFTKVDADKQPLKGAKFTLTKDGWEMTATSGEDGQVKFENIPSGHTYTLTETQTPVGYQSLDGTYTVEVAYGKAELLKDGVPVQPENGNLYVVNNRNQPTTGSLTIEKVFSGITPTENTFPDGITFTIQKVNDYGAADTTAAPTTVTLPKDGQWTDTVQLAPGTYTVTESDAEVTGYDLTVSNTVTTTTTDGKTGTVAVTADADKASTITFTNTYEKINADLVVYKNVTGNRGNYSSKAFTFRLTLTQPTFEVVAAGNVAQAPVNNAPPEINYSSPWYRIVRQDGTKEEGSVTVGMALEFNLGNGERLELYANGDRYDYEVKETNSLGHDTTVNGNDKGTIDVEKPTTVTFNNYKSGGDHYYPTPDPVPPIVIPPNTGDMTIWQSILHFLGIR